MYKVYIVPEANKLRRHADVYTQMELLWDPHAENDAYALVNPVWKAEWNKADSFEFTILPGNVHYNDFHKKKTVILLYDDDEWLFEGYVSSCPIDFFKQRKVTCVGALAYLCDTIQAPDEKNQLTNGISVPENLELPEGLSDPQSPKKVTYLKTASTKETIGDHINRLLEVHNSQTSYFKMIHIADGMIVADNEEKEFKSSSWRTTWSALETDVINEYGHCVRIFPDPHGDLRLAYLETPEMAKFLRKDLTTGNDKGSLPVIQLARNLIEFSEEDDSDDDLFTVLVPIGKDNLTVSGADSKYSAVTETSGPNNEIAPYIVDWAGNRRYVVVSDAAALRYGIIVKTVTFSDVTKADKLYTKAVEYIKNNYDNHTEYEVKAVDLHAIGETQYRRIMAGDQCRIISAWHGINTKNDDMFVISAEHDLESPENSSFKIGIPTTDREAKNKDLTSQTSSTSSSSKSSSDKSSSSSSNYESNFDKYSEVLDWLVKIHANLKGNEEAFEEQVHTEFAKFINADEIDVTISLWANAIHANCVNALTYVNTPKIYTKDIWWDDGGDAASSEANSIKHNLIMPMNGDEKTDNNLTLKATTSGDTVTLSFWTLDGTERKATFDKPAVLGRVTWADGGATGNAAYHTLDVPTIGGKTFYHALVNIPQIYSGTWGIDADSGEMTGVQYYDNYRGEEDGGPSNIRINKHHVLKIRMNADVQWTNWLNTEPTDIGVQWREDLYIEASAPYDAGEVKGSTLKSNIWRDGGSTGNPTYHTLDLTTAGDKLFYHALVNIPQIHSGAWGADAESGEMTGVQYYDNYRGDTDGPSNIRINSHHVLKIRMNADVQWTNWQNETPTELGTQWREDLYINADKAYEAGEVKGITDAKALFTIGTNIGTNGPSPASSVTTDADRTAHDHPTELDDKGATYEMYLKYDGARFLDRPKIYFKTKKIYSNGYTDATDTFRVRSGSGKKDGDTINLGPGGFATVYAQYKQEGQTSYTNTGEGITLYAPTTRVHATYSNVEYLKGETISVGYGSTAYVYAQTQNNGSESYDNRGWIGVKAPSRGSVRVWASVGSTNYYATDSTQYVSLNPGEYCYAYAQRKMDDNNDYVLGSTYPVSVTARHMNKADISFSGPAVYPVASTTQPSYDDKENGDVVLSATSSPYYFYVTAAVDGAYRTKRIKVIVNA